MENVITRHITKTPGVCGGRDCIAGHRIRVQDIVVLHEKCFGPDFLDIIFRIEKQLSHKVPRGAVQAAESVYVP